MICVFSNNKVGIYSTHDATLLYFKDENLNSKGCFIDEAGCFIMMFDETRTKANIHVIEWKYEVEPHTEKRRPSTVDSFDEFKIGSIDSNKALHDPNQSNLPNFKLKKQITDRHLKNKVGLGKSKSLRTEIYGRGMSPRSRKKALLKISTKIKERSKSPEKKSKACSIF